MSTFSERYGYVVKPLQLESMTIELRNRIWNIYRCEICNDIAVIDSHYLEEIMDACGLSYTSVYDNADLDKNLAVFRKWYDQAEWYRIYDFVEIYLAFLPTKDLSDAIDNFNGVLSAENAGYRVIGRQVVPITNEYEIKCIEQAQQTPYNSINVHLKKATELFSRRPLPDYENSIKESISAVEAVCSIITGLSGKNATLGKTIKICGIFICLSLFSSVIIINPYFIAVAIRNVSPEDVPLFPVNSIIFGFSVTIFLTLFWMSSSISRTVHCWEKIHSLISLSFISSNISEQVTIEWERIRLNAQNRLPDHQQFL